MKTFIFCALTLLLCISQSQAYPDPCSYIMDYSAGTLTRIYIDGAPYKMIKAQRNLSLSHMRNCSKLSLQSKDFFFLSNILVEQIYEKDFKIQDLIVNGAIQMKRAPAQEFTFFGNKQVIYIFDEGSLADLRYLSNINWPYTEFFVNGVEVERDLEKFITIGQAETRGNITIQNVPSATHQPTNSTAPQSNTTMVVRILMDNQPIRIQKVETKQSLADFKPQIYPAMNNSQFFIVNNCPVYRINEDMFQVRDIIVNSTASNKFYDLNIVTAPRIQVNISNQIVIICSFYNSSLRELRNLSALANTSFFYYQGFIIDKSEEQYILIQEIMVNNVVHTFNNATSRETSSYNTNTGRIGITDAPLDQYGNPIGSQYDLAKDGAFQNLTILIMDYHGANYGPANSVKAQIDQVGLQNKGVSYVVIFSEDELVRRLNSFDQLWIIPCQNQMNSSTITLINNYVQRGKGVWIFGGNRNQPSNVILNAMNFGVSSGGDQIRITMATSAAVSNGVIRAGNALSPNQFGSHPVTTGLNNIDMYGANCFINVNENFNVAGNSGNLQVVGTGMNGKPVIMSYQSPNGGGRILFDCYRERFFDASRIMQSDRYVRNVASWLAFTSSTRPAQTLFDTEVINMEGQNTNFKEVAFYVNIGCLVVIILASLGLYIYKRKSSKVKASNIKKKNPELNLNLV